MNEFVCLSFPVYKWGLMLFCILFIAACSNIQGGLTSTQVQRVVVYANHPEGGRSYEVLDTEDPKQIAEVFSGISKGSTPLYKCGHHGKIDFHKKDGTVVDAEFNYSESCAHLLFINKRGRLKGRPLTEKGRLFLMSLVKEGETDAK